MVVEAQAAAGYRSPVQLYRLALIVFGALATAIIAAVCAMPHGAAQPPAPWAAVQLMLLATYAAGLIVGGLAFRRAR